MMSYDLPITYVDDPHFLAADALFAVILSHPLELGLSDDFGSALEGAFLEFTETGLFRARTETTTTIYDLEEGLRRLDHELTALIQGAGTLTDVLRYSRARDLTRQAAGEAGVEV